MAILASQDKKSQKNEFKLGLRTRDVKNTNRLRLKMYTTDSLKIVSNFGIIGLTDQLHTVILHSKTAPFPFILTQSTLKWTLICPIDVPPVI